ncbi:hypothetical protein BS47DRAFT_1400537 [Hydnum rufescens UP504]|uniref:Uncharacterized protein n=1 Tax=Hydnum rufescens UP504 TaxID=1448309 RepID=A0A9P6DKR9_9AGAM|nr:hypothetical protein BS47DRAFT_1400537 [Hydnum rufescens UP504]
MSKHDLEPVASGSKRVRIESSDNDDEMDKNVLNYYTIRRLPMNSELDRLDLDDAEALINEDKHLHTTLNSCWAIQKFADVRRVTKFQMPMSSDILQEWEPLPRVTGASPLSSRIVGKNHGDKDATIRRLGLVFLRPPVTQSSGTGKSRMIDELSKEHLVIPIVLRDSDGYPPPDIAPRDWFLQASTPERAQKCAIAFLMALFETTKEIIGGIDDLTPPRQAKRYRRPSVLNSSFYERVVEIGKGITICPTTQRPDRKPTSGGENDDPVFILAFDEAHVLTRRHLSISPPPEDAHRHEFSKENCARVRLHCRWLRSTGYTIREGEISIEDASSDARIAFLGRPLFGSRYREGSDTIKSTIVSFAREKLVGSKDVLDWQSKLACLAMRIPVQFDSKSDLGAETSAALVERHMRICLDDSPRADALVSHLNDSGPDKGNRGELLAMLLLILHTIMPRKKKQSKSSGQPNRFSQGSYPCRFDSRRLGQSAYYQRAESDDVALEDSFSEARIWFSHFVKVHENGVLTRKYLWGLIARGAAVICVDNQMGIDLVIPFIAGDHKLTEENVGVILIQVKNDQNFNEKPLDKLYGGMDPRISGDPAVVVRQRERRTTRRKASNFTSYDIWLAKASSQTFGPIKIEEEDQYTLALRLTKTFPHVYHDEGDPRHLAQYESRQRD